MKTTRTNSITKITSDSKRFVNASVWLGTGMNGWMRFIFYTRVCLPTYLLFCWFVITATFRSNQQKIYFRFCKKNFGFVANQCFCVIYHQLWFLIYLNRNNQNYCCRNVSVKFCWNCCIARYHHTTGNTSNPRIEWDLRGRLWLVETVTWLPAPTFWRRFYSYIFCCVCISSNAKRAVNFLPSATSLKEKLRVGNDKFKTVAMDTLSEPIQFQPCYGQQISYFNSSSASGGVVDVSK